MDFVGIFLLSKIYLIMVLKLNKIFESNRNLGMLIHDRYLSDISLAWPTNGLRYDDWYTRKI